ncbi:MAG: hypothetical protein EPO24_10205 [Bacteroidetes bacterium]|nr:MAG: hypothetical protein EPO24_10205 [Bacteroidota bacterium]
MSSIIEKYYQKWINTPKILYHPQDIQQFYKFVKACLKYKRKHLDGHWLRKKLEKDLVKLFGDNDYTRQLIQDAVNLFQHLIDFQNTSFPDVMLEMREPYKVSMYMRGLRDQNGKPCYTYEQVESALIENFGTDWQKGTKK